MIEYVLAIVLIILAVFLFKPRRHIGRYTDIKEAPLQINSAMKDITKRKIIRSLRNEKKYLTVIAKEVGDSVAKTKYHLQELEKLGLVAVMRLTREKFFLLTEKGKWCLKAIDIYYPKNYFELIKQKIKPSQLKWLREAHSTF